MTSIQFSGCDLHIPHKEWSGDENERQNYLEMERWANHFRKNCLPKAGGGVGTIHRVKYGGNQWMHTTSGGVTSTSATIAGDGTNHYLDWTAAFAADGIDSSVFVPDSSVISTIPVLRVTTNGLLSWTGRFDYGIDTSTPPANWRIWFDLLDVHSLTQFEQEEDRLGAPTSTTIHGTGGGVYVPADTWLEIAGRQTSGLTGTIGYGITWTLLEM